MSNVEEESASPIAGARWTSMYASMKAAILAHSLQPGTKLPEDDLAEVYAVSRTVVRAALQALMGPTPATSEPAGEEPRGRSRRPSTS